MAYISRIVFIMAVTAAVRIDDEDLESSDPHEVMIAQESRNYQTFLHPPVRIIKPNGVTNSHRPQYNLDSLEEELANIEIDDFFDTTTRKGLYKTYNPHNARSKEVMIRDAVLKALERKDHIGKFAQILPIIRAMSGSQRVTLASLVASQVTTPPGRAPLNLSQVRSMFDNENNSTSDLMLPILLDMANLIRRAIRPGKETREVKQPQTLPQTQLLRRSFTEDDNVDDEQFDAGVIEANTNEITTTKAPVTVKNRYRINRPQSPPATTKQKHSYKTDNNRKTAQDNKTLTENMIENNTKEHSDAQNNTTVSNDSATKPSSTTSEPLSVARGRSLSVGAQNNATYDLMAEATNQSLAQELPVPEKLRVLNRYGDRKGNTIRRGTYVPKYTASRRTTVEPAMGPVSRRRPAPARKLPRPIGEQNKCEMFTNTLCLHSDDYPTEAIVMSIRRNKAAAAALLADFKDPGEGAVDGITAAQEAKYTADHYLISNRRGDTANRDFAGAGEAGFMCPSTVKYARPQRARATSGQWKYIVNTGEHTQTLRLEKCLKPKESCTYLTDNFKSKCVQVYNYHRLLTWDQENGLHMDIFKIPTCCSCHIEGYSVSFPPLGHRVHETSSEYFPGEDLSSEHGNQASEVVQSSIQRPSFSKTPFSLSKPLHPYSPFVDNHNTIPGPLFSDTNSNDNDDFNNLSHTNIKDSYGNSYFPDSLNQPSSVRNTRKPLSPRSPIGGAEFDIATLPSYLEPPTRSASSSFSFSKESINKYKINDSLFKRGISRPNIRPIRKKISNTSGDLVSSGTSAVGTLSNSGTEEELNDDYQDSDVRKLISKSSARVTIAPKLHAVTTAKALRNVKTQGQKYVTKEEITSNGKRVNYNYHPIIDFFDEEEQEEGESIDREDSVSSYEPTLDSEWRPINHPASRSAKSSDELEKQ